MALLPTNMVTKTKKHDPQYVVKRQKVWQGAMAQVFEDYNQVLQDGVLVRCSDGQVRNIAFVLASWLGDQKEQELACCMVSVSPSLSS